MSGLEEQVRAFVSAEVARRVEELREDKWLDSEAAANYLSCSRGRIHNLVSEGKLPRRKEGGRLVFSVRELNEWIRSGRAAA